MTAEPWTRTTRGLKGGGLRSTKATPLGPRRGEAGGLGASSRVSGSLGTIWRDPGVYAICWGQSGGATVDAGDLTLVGPQVRPPQSAKQWMRG